MRPPYSTTIRANVALVIAVALFLPAYCFAQGFKTFGDTGPTDLQLVLDLDAAEYTDDWYWNYSLDADEWDWVPYVFYQGSRFEPVDESRFFSPSREEFYIVRNLTPVLLRGGGEPDQGYPDDDDYGDDEWDWWDEEEEDYGGIFLTEDELNDLLKREYNRGLRAGRTAGFNQGLKEGRADGYAKGLAEGRREVTRNPARFKLLAAGNVPGGIVVSTKKGNTVTISLAGKWSRFAANGVPKGWKFDQKRGQLTGKVARSGKVKLQAYKGNSAAAPIHIEFKATK